MKAGIGMVVALLIGLVLGGWGPRADLRALQDRIHELEGKQRRQESMSGKMEGVKAMLKVKDEDMTAAKARAKVRKSQPFKPAFTPATNQPPAIASSTNAPDTNATGKLGDHLKEASDLWATRVQMARNSFITNLGLNAQQTAMFDGAMAVMNTQMEQSINKWADSLKQKDSMNGEDGVKIVNDLSTVLVKSYGELDQTMPEGWRQKAGDGFDLVNFIDPSVALPLTEVEGKINRHQRRGGSTVQEDGVTIELQ